MQGGSPKDLLNIFLEPTTMFAVFVVCTALVLAIKTKYWPTLPIKLGQFIRELDTRLSSITTPFIIRIVNDDLPELSKPISERIASTEIWDWTFVGRHPDYEPASLSENLLASIKSQYFRANDGRDIRTSSLCLLKSYPPGLRWYTLPLFWLG